MIQSTRTKICGLTRSEDVVDVARYGADAIGLVFYEPSPRCVTIEQAKLLSKAIPPFVSVVALFVNADKSFVEQVLAQVPIDILQFHGDEPEAYCASFNKPYLKAIRVKPDTDLLQCAAEYHSARGLLLDAHVDGVPGGTGTRFDWSLIPPDIPLPVILSGGLDVKNVADGIKQVKPYAVDVSSGVEAAKGIKDEAKIARFMQEVKQTNV